ncbi:hypothetical protein [Mycobacterium sp. 852002-10029_SCH5224772]|uniref:hypothetical protein n=1 Tax=Mycobacterium sp. 852002-10029_SCH5224772 TaxID=1834083 RepID=UPI0007FE3E7C|nr:hypothetical protein [Mycobacterium sp. 852002-10029_SCH5224772]OBF10398.1 hypothetical protein A5775_18470 [Mycobacterium sp. 852002-10029_SCH5224772]
MSYESNAEPIEIGYLMDFRLPDAFPATYFEDLTRPFDYLVARRLDADGVNSHLVDRFGEE